MRKKRSLWWGTLTLTGAAVASRGLGLVYRMLLARFLGAEGLGFFQMIFPFYVALVTLAVAGTPVAVSQLIAEEHTNPRRLMRLALIIVTVVSVPLIGLVIMLAKPLAVMLYHDPRFIPLIITIAPALIAVGFSAVLRGYFVGIQQLTYPALSQVSEQLSRVVILYTILNFIGRHAFHNAPLVAVALIPIGEGVSLVILALAYVRSYAPLAGVMSHTSKVRDILRLSVPVTFSRLLGSLVGVIEAFFIPMRLEAAGMSPYNAIRYFGQLTGMALPLIFFPTALTLSLSTNLVPVVAHCHSAEDEQGIREAVMEGLEATAVFTVPVTILLLALGIKLDDLFFHAHIHADVFYPLVLGGFFLYFDITLSGALRGLGRTDIPMRNDLIASALEILMIYLLSINPRMAPTGIPTAIGLGFVLSMVFNAVSFTRLSRIRIPWGKILLRPLASSIPVLLTLALWHIWGMGRHLPQAESLMGSIGLTILAYLLSLRLTGPTHHRLL
ncbi:polysaccharide biosynthesis protein [Sulfobacillus sp. hq2]|nr:polysaccharide biosynthesis protein [Sulfobacillus sp. hq2]MCY0909450.1 polysaccharide biosynthesis protein [Sulfobacillus thermotolerans]POB09205.1 polysaccharide biosynthesis protein [Sulfobacillus sp. hq2]